MADATSIKAALRAAFRDHEVDGVPASGVNDPDKSAIRAALASLVDLLDVAGTTKVVATVADLAELAPIDFGERAEVRADPLGDVEDGNGVWSWTGAAWIWISDLVPATTVDRITAAERRHVAPKAALVEQNEIDGTRSLIVPGLIGFENGSFDAASDPAGAVFEQAIPLTGGEVTHYLDTAGGALTAGVAGSVFGGPGQIALGRSFLGRFHTPYRIIRPGQASPNMAPWGQDMSLCPLLRTTTTTAACRTAEALARGFTVGAVNLTDVTYAGGPLDKVRSNFEGFIRAHVELNAGETEANRPANLTAFFLSGYGTGSVGSVTLTFERMIGARLAAYVFRGSVPFVGVAWFWVGGFNNANWRLCGVQAHWSAAPVDWVDRLDFPAPAGQTLPATLSVTSGHPVSLDIRGLSPTIDDDARVTWSSYQDAAPRLPWFDSGPVINVDPTRLGSTLEVLVRPRAGAPVRTARTITVEKAGAAASAAAPKILLVGDSLFVRQIGYLLNLDLGARGMAPTFLGTVPGWGAGAGYDGPSGEARGGRRFTDYTGQTTDLLAPVAAGDEAAYLALSVDDRLLKNPFLRVAVAGDVAAHPTWVFDRAGTNYIFDMAHYLSRWTPDIANPDFVFVSLGTNDFLNPGAAGTLAGVELGMDILIGQIRAALPNAHIVFCNPALGLGGYEAYRAAAHGVRRAIQAKIAAARTAGDLKVHFMDWALFQNVDAGWGQSALRTDVTGTQLWDMADAVHFATVNRYAAVGAIGSFIRFRV